MAATAGFWNSATAQQASPLTARPMSDTGNGSTQNSSSTISSNDFLTLLVTEMKNQDPTASTDPNEYVNQLVSVNSLEQLIQINQTLGAAVSAGPGATEGHSIPSNATGASASQPGLGAHQAASVSENARTPVTTVHARATDVTSGNLAVPRANPAAQRIAQALSGRGHVA
jgi:flagellar basal-body rod modification protein FlgD